MPIVNNTPIVKDPIPQKEYPHIWIRSIRVVAPNATKGNISIQCLPYNGTTGEIAPLEDSFYIESDDLWGAIAAKPEIAQAMGAIFAAVLPLKDFINPPVSVDSQIDSQVDSQIDSQV